MRKFLLSIVLIVAAASVIANSNVVGSKHDLSSTGTATGKSTNVTEVCVFCHTPHQPTGQTTDPLWNHTLATTASYSVYGSTTMNATPADIGGGSAASNLCMSCHDGSVGLGSLYNNPNDPNGAITPSNSATNIASTALLGTDLSNDHPVNFDYDTTLVTADGGLVAVASLPAWALSGGKVQCSSCHDAHDTTYVPFLTTSNTASALCTTCHIK